MSRENRDGLYKRCDCHSRKWTKCEHPWHFDFYCKRTAHLYGNRAKHRYSLDVIAKARSEQPPRTKGDAEALADRIRSEIRSGTFIDPNRPPSPPPPDPSAALTVGDIIGYYEARHVPWLDDRRPRRESAQRTMRWHLGVLRRTEIPVAHGQQVRFELRPIKDVTKADIEAIRNARRRAQTDAVAARAQWEQEAAALAKAGKELDRPKPRVLPGDKGGEIGINRLLERLRHLFSWAIAEGYIDKTPFRRDGVVVFKLNNKAETRRDRTLYDAPDSLHLSEEEALLRHATTPLMRDLIIAGIATGCRSGELLSLQWREVQYTVNPKGGRVASALLLSAEKTKTGKPRRIDVDSKLSAVLDMRRHAPDGKPLGPDAFVFGNEVGERVGSVRKAWATTKLKAYGHKPQWVKGRSNQLSADSLAALKRINLHFHDLRAEFATRVASTGSTLVDVRDLLGHTDTKTTDTYLRSKSKALRRAIERKEAHERELEQARRQAREENCHPAPGCDNPALDIFFGSDSPEVVKH